MVVKILGGIWVVLGRREVFSFFFFRRFSICCRYKRGFGCVRFYKFLSVGFGACEGLVIF